jgi:hypothetical protein
MRVLAALEALRDQVRDEILQDPRYLTYQALQRSIDDIKAALDGAGASTPPGPGRVVDCSPPASANGSAAPRGVPFTPQVDSEAMANLQHALIDLINRDHGGTNGAGGSVEPTDAVAVPMPPFASPPSDESGSDPTGS